MISNTHKKNEKEFDEEFVDHKEFSDGQKYRVEKQHVGIDDIKFHNTLSTIAITESAIEMAEKLKFAGDYAPNSPAEFKNQALDTLISSYKKEIETIKGI